MHKAYKNVLKQIFQFLATNEEIQKKVVVAEDYPIIILLIQFVEYPFLVFNGQVV